MGIVKDLIYTFASPSLQSFLVKKPIFPYYHIVTDKKVQHIQHLYPFKGIDQFINDMDYLTARLKPMNPSALWSDNPPNNTFLLTFDDGLAEIYTVIYPLLKQRNINAVFFINPAFVDNKKLFYKHGISILIDIIQDVHTDQTKIKSIRTLFNVNGHKDELIRSILLTPYQKRHLIDDCLELVDFDAQQYLKLQQPFITKAQIQEMISDGFYFGGHTMHHPPLNQIEFKDQLREITESLSWMKENFDLDYSMFAFPFSDKSASKKLLKAMFDYDENLIVFGNSGIKKDIDPRIIQRFSLENPTKKIGKQIVMEHIYKYFNLLTGQYHIRRND